MTHICVSKLTIIASDSGLSPGRLYKMAFVSVMSNVCSLLVIAVLLGPCLLTPPNFNPSMDK